MGVLEIENRSAVSLSNFEYVCVGNHVLMMFSEVNGLNKVGNCEVRLYLPSPGLPSGRVCLVAPAGLLQVCTPGLRTRASVCVAFNSLFKLRGETERSVSS